MDNAPPLDLAPNAHVRLLTRTARILLAVKNPPANTPADAPHPRAGEYADAHELNAAQWRGLSSAQREAACATALIPECGGFDMTPALIVAARAALESSNASEG